MATLKFAVRGTSKTAYYSNGGSTPAEIGSNSVDSGAATGVISNSVINLDQSSAGQHALIYPGYGNLGTTNKMSVLWRGAFADTGSSRIMFSITGHALIGRVMCRYTGTQLRVDVADDTTGAAINFGTVNFTPVAGTYYDIVLLLDCSTTTSGASIKLYQDGTLVLNPNNATSTWPSTINTRNKLILLGMDDATTLITTRTKVNEFVIWEDIIDPTSGGLNLNGSSRSSFVTVSALDGAVYTDPGASNVKTGTSYTAAGVSQTGTYTGSDRWTDPGIANVRSGTAYKADSTSNNRTGTAAIPTAANVRSGTSTDATTGTLAVPSAANVRSGTSVDAGTGTLIVPAAADVRSGTSVDATTGTLDLPSTANVKTGVTFDGATKTGTYDGSDRHTDPGVANVRSGTAYKSNSTTNNRTGTLAVPTAANVRSGTSVDAGTGTLIVPATADVRSGTSVDATTGTLDLPATTDVKTGVTYDGASKTGTYDGSDRHTDPGVANVRSGTAYKSNSVTNNRTGTAAIPSAANVRSGTATDATTGTLAVPSAANVRSGVAVDATTGTLTVPTLANTKIGVAGDGGTGTYTGADRWSDPGEENVSTGITYNANAVAKTGTRDTVTNTLSNLNLEASAFEATLEEAD